MLLPKEEVMISDPNIGKILPGDEDQQSLNENI